MFKLFMRFGKLKLQLYCKNLNVKMTALAFNQSLSKVHTLASRMNSSLTPFFFLRQKAETLLNEKSRVTIKVNRQMTPFLNNLPKTARLGFWSLSQFQSLNINKNILENSIILNPYKTQRLIRIALTKGIRKMIISDAEQLIKIQDLYFKLRKERVSVKEPEYIWSVENSQRDLQNILDIKKCSLPIDGIYFSSEMCETQVKNFLEMGELNENKDIQKFRELAKQKLEGNKQLEDYGMEAVLTDFSETNNYLMACRIIGWDKNKQPIFDNSCLDFICKLDSCSCSVVKPKIEEILEAEGCMWATIRPLRLDRLKEEYIVE